MNNSTTLTFPAQSPTPTTSAASAPASYSELLQHPERYYQGSDLVWIMVSAALVFLMIPSLSLIYAGLGNRSFALTLFRLPLVTGAFIGLEWVLWGYALTFSDGPLWWGGEMKSNALMGVLAMPVSTGDGPGGPQIPELVYVLFEGMFASFTAALVCGGTMHRARPARFIIFITLWSLLIYAPVARWSWSPYGWSKQYGTLDFAGGTPVHIVSGTTVAAFAIFCSIESKKNTTSFLSEAKNRLKQRFSHIWGGIWSMLRIFCMVCTCGCLRLPHHNPTPDSREGREPEEISAVNGPQAAEARPQPIFQPYNVNYIVFGTALLWFGWAGFNGGSALGGNLRAVSAWTSTHIAACAGGVTGMLWIWLWKVMPDELDADTGSQTETISGEPSPNRGLEKRKTFDRLSVFFFCDGAISGLVAITPAAGYVPVWSAAIFGLVSAIFVNMLKKETEMFLRNDPLQIFAVHTGGGFVGMALTALFVDPVIIGLDGHSTIPHPEYSKGQRLGYQLLDGFMGMLYTFLVTLSILYFMKLVAFWLPTSCHEISVYDEENRLEDEYQATMSQYWRGGLDPMGRPQIPTVQTEIPQQPPRIIHDRLPIFARSRDTSLSPQLPPVHRHGTL